MCVCSDPYSTKRQLLECTACGYYCHKDCMSANSQMKKFMCAHCQLMYIDPLQIPVKTILKPFLVYQISENDK